MHGCHDAHLQLQGCHGAWPVNMHMINIDTYIQTSLSDPGMTGSCVNLNVQRVNVQLNPGVQATIGSG